MKILALLKVNSLLVSTLKERGHSVTSIRDHTKVVIPFPYNGTLGYRGRVIDLGAYDAILLLSTRPIAKYLFDLLSPHHLVIGNPYSRALMGDKVLTGILLGNNGIPIVPSIYSIDPPSRVDLARIGSTVLVEKPVNLQRGIGVIKIEGLDFTPKSDRIYQEYIECGAQDERWIIVNGKVTNVELRKALVPGEFRIGNRYGGTTMPLSITPEIQSLGEKIYKCFQDPVYIGADVIRSTTGKIYVGEVNSRPHPRTIKVTGHNFFEEVVDYIEERVKEK